MRIEETTMLADRLDTHQVHQLTAFAQRHGITELSLFGSILRDDFNEASDVDVLIELSPNRTMSIETFLAMQDELQQILGRSVDLVEKPLVRNPIRRAEILRAREVIYAA